MVSSSLPYIFDPPEPPVAAIGLPVEHGIKAVIPMGDQEVSRPFRPSALLED